MATLASNGGAFVLRLEDTDRNRFVPDAEERLISDLKWAGLKWDEGPDCGGPYGPYRQSERLSIYKEHSQQLLDQGHAYRCFCSQEQLDAQKQRAHEAGQSTAYQKTCRSISSEESDNRAAAGEPHMLRFKGDTFGRPKFRDTIFGPFQKGEEEDDFVILKTDGYPTYHLANVIDDHLMKITHVIRGEEWLISTPKHLALYSAFGWEPPTFSHLALLVNPDGSKLSKRQNSQGISSQRDAGMPPMPLVTWLVSQGGITKMNKTMSDHPRNVTQLAKMMKFESLKRVPIRVDHDQLTTHQLAYIRSLAQQHVDPASNLLRASEVSILDDFCRSILQKANELQSSGSADSSFWPDELWNGEQELLLSFQDGQTRSGLGNGALPLYHLLSLPQISSLDPVELLRTYPYLVWQVPELLYQTNLARWASEAGALPTEEILDVLERCLHDESCAASSWLAQIQDCEGVKEAGKEAMPTMYALLRLIATGAHDQPSPPAKILFSAIGRIDWLKRVQSIRKLLSAMQRPVA
ncbi:tRNA synthetases class I (E and q), catalytic domain-containing protein [Sarocladium implicatum]|nr:tRNA synthetases class I (E and q), catalytic domain-containing protein [Sarocladium implicatum]